MVTEQWVWPPRLQVIDDQLSTDKYVVLMPHQYEQAGRLALLDTDIYSWGHCGHVLFHGRFVIRQETLGL